MRQWLRPGGIERLSLEARVVYTVFLVFMLVGYATSVWFYLDDDLGVTGASAARYFHGDASAQTKPSGSGPALDLPSEATAAVLRVEKPARQVMETFHFHLFSVPVCLLILAHMFMMCGLPAGWKMGSIIATSLATLLHMLAPVLIRFVAPGFGWLMFPSALVMGLGWLLMTGWPLVEMWVRLPEPLDD